MLPIPPLQTSTLLSVFVNLTILDTSHKWNCPIFVLSEDVLLIQWKLLFVALVLFEFSQKPHSGLNRNSGGKFGSALEKNQRSNI